MTDTSSDSRASALVEEIKSRIEEIKVQMQPAFESLAAKARTKVEEISDDIDQKLDELGALLGSRQ
jgi:hypothetical protein